jgi:hypothetical protein
MDEVLSIPSDEDLPVAPAGPEVSVECIDVDGGRAELSAEQLDVFAGLGLQRQPASKPIFARRSAEHAAHARHGLERKRARDALAKSEVFSQCPARSV